MLLKQMVQQAQGRVLHKNIFQFFFHSSLSYPIIRYLINFDFELHSDRVFRNPEDDSKCF